MNMCENRQQPNLVAELEKNEMQKIYILTGERGLGKHYAMRAAEQTLLSKSGQTVISIHSDETSFSLWPVEESLRRINPDIGLPSQDMNNGLNYIEQLTRCFIDLCRGPKRTLIFLYHFQAFSNDLWAFVTRLFRLLLDPYRSSNVCFCCCLHTDADCQGETAVQIHSTQQAVELFSRFARNTSYLQFQPWPQDALRGFLEKDIFQGKLLMSEEQKTLLLDSVMGNPAALLRLTEQMKIRGVLYERDGSYYCRDIDGTALLSYGPVPAKEQYERLDIPLQELLRGSSVIGVEFEANLLSNPLEFLAVESKLKRILDISRIIRQNVDSLYEFESMFARLSIREFVSDEESILWNSRLGDYFWRLSQQQIAEGAGTVSLNSLKKSAFYYDEAMNRPRAVQLYDRLVRGLMAIMQYTDAVKIIRRIRTLCENVPGLYSAADLTQTWQLEADCYRYRSEYSKAIPAYEKFLNRAQLTKYERLDVQCSYCDTLYESGEVHHPLRLLRQSLADLKNDTDPQAAPVLVHILSSLASIEETLCDTQHEYHFNAALDIAKRYQLNDEYYSLLRNALIVHKGIYGIGLMESARKYFEHTGNCKELAKVLNNIAVELLLCGDLDQARVYYQHSAELFRSFGSETAYVPVNGLGDYWCLRGDFARALPLFEEAFQEDTASFSRIGVLLNQATAYRKLGRYTEAASRLDQAEQISNTEDASEYAILLPHLLIGKALLLYDQEGFETAYPLFLRYIREETSFGRRRKTLAAHYLLKICEKLNWSVPTGIWEAAQVLSPADERLLRYGVTLIRFSITD